MSTQIDGMLALLCHSIALNRVAANLFKGKTRAYLKALYVVTLDRELAKAFP